MNFNSFSFYRHLASHLTFLTVRSHHFQMTTRINRFSPDISNKVLFSFGISNLLLVFKLFLLALLCEYLNSWSLLWRRKCRIEENFRRRFPYLVDWFDMWILVELFNTFIFLPYNVYNTNGISEYYLRYDKMDPKKFALKWPLSKI